VKEQHCKTRKINPKNIDIFYKKGRKKKGDERKSKLEVRRK